MKLKLMNFILPRVRIDGDSDSGASWLTNSFRSIGWMNAMAVSDVVATPGVLEKMSEMMPRMNPTASDSHRGALVGKMMTPYTISSGVAHPKRWMLFSMMTCAANSTKMPTIVFIILMLIPMG
jgi:hypothetical protein